MDTSLLEESFNGSILLLPMVITNNPRPGSPIALSFFEEISSGRKGRLRKVFLRCFLHLFVTTPGLGARTNKITTPPDTSWGRRQSQRCVPGRASRENSSLLFLHYSCIFASRLRIIKRLPAESDVFRNGNVFSITGLIV